MADKADVINSGVPQPPQENSVKDGAVPESVKKAIENEVRENLRAEFSRKSEELSEQLEDARAELEELRNAPPAEKAVAVNNVEELEQRLADMTKRIVDGEWNRSLKDQKSFI